MLLIQLEVLMKVFTQPIMVLDLKSMPKAAMVLSISIVILSDLTKRRRNHVRAAIPLDLTLMR